MQINRNKTRMMIVDRAYNDSFEVTDIANCKVVPSHLYFGAPISNEGDCVVEIERGMAITRSAIDKTQKIRGNHNITKATNTRLFKILTYPIFLNDAKT